MPILRRINLNAAGSPALTNEVVVVPLCASTFDFAAVNTNGRNLDVLDSDGTTSLSHQLRDWGTGIGMRLIETRPVPTGSDPHPYIFATAIFTGNLGLANDPHTIWGVGSELDVAPGTYGQFICYDKTGAVTWTHQSPNHDYPMSCHIGDVNGDGQNEVAVGFRLLDSIGQVLDNHGNLLWTYNQQPVNAGVKSYVRIARIGKMRSDLAGNEVLFGGAYGCLTLCDHLGNILWSRGDGGTLPRFSAPENPSTCQAAIIDDLAGSGTNAIYVVQNSIVRKVDNTGAVVWTHTHPSIDAAHGNPNTYTIASGHITSLTSKQLVVSTASSSTTSPSNIGHVYVLDSTGAVQWERCIPAPSYSVNVGDVNGDGYDEVIVTWGTQTSYFQGDGWGGVIILDRFGNHLAATSTGSSLKFIQWGDSDGDGQNEIMASCDDGHMYRWLVETSGGAAVKVTVPAITAGSSKTIFLASSANPTLIPALGAFDFQLSGANGSAPPGMTSYLGAWTIQAGTIQSPSDGNTSSQTSIEAAGVTTDGLVFDFTGVKNNQADGSLNYYLGCRYRCTTWTLGLPKGFLFQISSTGVNCQLYETGAGTAAPVQVLFSTATSGITFNLTDVMRFRVVVSGVDHAALYSKNGGPWTLIYHVRDASGTPNTGSGTVALYSGRGQAQYSALALHTIPSAFGAAGAGPGPILTITASTYTITLPPTGAVGVAQVATVTPLGLATGTITLTPAGCGLTTAQTLTWAGSSVAQTASFTPTLAGTLILAGTNNQGLVDPSPVSDTITSPLAPPSAYFLLESGNQILLESGAGLTREDVVVPTGYFLLENGFHVLLESGAGLASEDSLPTIPSTAALGGPTSGPVGTPSANFTVALDLAANIGGVVCTLSSSNVGDTITPAPLVIAAGTSIGTFTLTPVSPGPRTVSLVATSPTLAVTGSPITYTAGAVAPTTATLSGPTTATSGVTTDIYTIIVERAAIAPVTCTVTSSNGGDTFTSTPVVIPIGATQGTFKVTPHSTGSRTITLATSPVLTIHGSPITLAVSAPLPPETFTGSPIVVLNPAAMWRPGGWR